MVRGLCPNCGHRSYCVGGHLCETGSLLNIRIKTIPMERLETLFYFSLPRFSFLIKRFTGAIEKMFQNIPLRRLFSFHKRSHTITIRSEPLSPSLCIEICRFVYIQSEIQFEILLEQHPAYVRPGWSFQEVTGN